MQEEIARKSVSESNIQFWMENVTQRGRHRVSGADLAIDLDLRLSQSDPLIT
jgi:hypothetical protein